ncbi:hypothetical protein NMG60_11007883 [Bertholletia excelsa]
MEHNLTIKTYMTIMAERDNAIRERNMALEERRRAFAERDMAMLQRDAALSERNSAMEERDKALATLQYRESSMNENNISPDSPGDEVMARGANSSKHLYPDHEVHPVSELPETAYDPICDPLVASGSGSTKFRKVKQAKNPSKPPRKGKRGPESTNHENGWENELHLGGGDNEECLERQLVLPNDNSQVIFDESTMPVPVCSCTGSPQPCYKWGNGGWQSACCTTTMSMYPLPQISNKRHARVGGRKMSGSAFNKLLIRLAAEGHNLYTPLDLKDHWAKHGTNRYSTLK